MIKITIATKNYTRKELTDILSRRFPSKKDIDYFLTMMQKTGQLRYDHGTFIPVESKETISTGPRYLTAPPEESVIGERINRVYVFRWTYYVYGGKKLPRIAIRAGKKWVERNGTPVKATLLKIKKDNVWIDIPEEPIMKPGKPRYPTSVEAYRAEIPRYLVRKYDINRDTPCRVRIDVRVKKYYTTLNLWGIQLRTITTTFGETPNGVGERNLELRGETFSYESGTDIVDLFKRNAEQVLKITHYWLYDLNEEYYWLLYQCNTTKYDDKPDLTTGTSYEPLKKRPTGEVAKITFTDIKYGRVIASGTATLPPYWDTDKVSTVVSKFTNINHIAMIARKKDYISVLTGKEGF